MQRLDELKRLVASLYGSKNPDADEWCDWGYPHHVLVVATLAEELAKRHHANVEFAVAGALLHDVADAVMPRERPDHEEASLTLADELLQKAGYARNETDEIVNEIIKPHSCHELLPATLEGKIVATADGMAHFVTDFYPLFCWRHYGPDEPGDPYHGFKAWVLRKIEKDFTKKLFFEDAREAVRPRYEALKLLFGPDEPGLA